MSKNLPVVVEKTVTAMTERPAPKLNYQINGMREVVEGFAKAAFAGQITTQEGIRQCESFVRLSLDGEHKALMRPFREERQALLAAKEQLESEIQEVQMIIRFQSPIKEIKRIVHRQRWTAFVKISFYLMMAAAMFAGLFGVLNASKALVTSQIGYFGHEVQAFIVSLILIAPPLAVKGFLSLVPDFKMAKLMKILFSGLLISLLGYVFLFSFINAPTPIESTGLFSEEPIPASRVPSILLLFFQLLLEMFTTASLMAVCMVTEKRHTESHEETGLVDNPDYRHQKSKLLEYQSLDQKLTTRLSLIDSCVEEHLHRIEALTTEAQHLFFQKMRSI